MALRAEAVRLHGAGRKLREIGRELGINHQTVLNWIRSAPDTAVPLPLAPSTSQNDTPDPAAAAPRPSRPAEPQRRATIHDVAAVAGVSNSTVSNYLNHKGHMGPATRQRIEAAIEELHFTPSALVRAIRRRQTRILGVVLFGLDTLDVEVGQSIAPPLLAGINRAAEDAEYDVLLYPGWLYRPRRHPGLPFLDGHIDGLLWVAPAMEEPTLQRVADAGLPTVALLTRHVPERVGFVNSDNVGAIGSMIDHLIGAGHQRIAYVGPTYSSNYGDRHTGYLQSLAERRLPWKPEWEALIPEHHWMNDTYGAAIDRWLGLPDAPTAIITPSDGIAAIVVDEIIKRGLRVPEDFAVTGYDDVPNAERIAGGLTTIRQPFRQIGIAAVERLLVLIEGADVTRCCVTLPADIVARTTTAAPPRTAPLKIS